jgi:hypothetical protein
MVPTLVKTLQHRLALKALVINRKVANDDDNHRDDLVTDVLAGILTLSIDIGMYDNVDVNTFKSQHCVTVSEIQDSDVNPISDGAEIQSSNINPISDGTEIQDSYINPISGGAEIQSSYANSVSDSARLSLHITQPVDYLKKNPEFEGMVETIVFDTEVLKALNLGPKDVEDRWAYPLWTLLSSDGCLAIVSWKY